MKNFIERKSCPACAATNLSILYSKEFTSSEIMEYLTRFYGRQGGIEMEYLSDAQYVLAECKSCSLIFQKHIGNDMLLEKLYEHWIDPDKVFNDEVLQLGMPFYLHYAHEVSNLIAHFDTNPEKLSFLDFGMGWGKWALMVQAFGCQSYGSELSQRRIEYAQKNGIKVLSYEEIRKHAFDFINTEQVFEHIPEPLETLRYIKQSLKPGGVVKISVPDASDLKRRMQKMDWKAEKWTPDSLNAAAPLEHINSFNRDSIVRMAKEAELVPIEISFRIQPMRMTKKNRGVKERMKDAIRPIYRSVVKPAMPDTYLFFTHGK